MPSQVHHGAAGLRIVRAETDPLLEAARDFLLWRTEADYGYGYEPAWHWDLDDPRSTYVANPRQALWVALAPAFTVSDGGARAGENAAHVDGETGHEVAVSAPGEPPRRGELPAPLPGQLSRERVVATVAIRMGGPKVPPHPPMFAERYPDPPAVAQLVRLMVSPDHRRLGLASSMTRTAVDFAQESGYSIVYLHTNALVPGALEFWRRNAVEVYDARGTEYDEDPRFETVHFEIPLERC